jgi:hypothetical protein
MNAIACAGSLRRLGDRAPTSRKRQADHDDGADQHADLDHSAFAVARCITKGPPLVERQTPLTKGEVPAPQPDVISGVTHTVEQPSVLSWEPFSPLQMSAVTVALGTDGASTNDNLDLHEVMRSTKVPIYKLIQRPEDA